MYKLVAPTIRTRAAYRLTSFNHSSRSIHSFATVEVEEISGSQPAKVNNLVQGKWIGSSSWTTILDPLSGEPFIKVAEVDETGIQPFVESLSKCPKHGLHNPFKSPERYLLCGDISVKAAHMLCFPSLSAPVTFYLSKFQRISVVIRFASWQDHLQYPEITWDNKVMVFDGLMALLQLLLLSISH
ncbi:aldehyde dehydrogenase 12A1 [Euphorbia peplus]|nr:aldehyde dehydrogenase 12A1 [Euphorbia peplus]